MSKRAGGSNDDAVSWIHSYLSKANRPYSLTDIVTNSHNQFSKTVALKAVNQLVQDEIIICKAYGKQSVYLIRQDNKENTPTQAELSILDEQIQKLKESLAEVSDENRGLQSELAKLQQSKTDSELKEAIDLLENENQLLRVKLDKIKGGENLVDLDEKRKLDVLIAIREKEFKNRKKIQKNIVDTLSESMGKKPQDLMDEFGLDPIPQL